MLCFLQNLTSKKQQHQQQQQQQAISMGKKLPPDDKQLFGVTQTAKPSTKSKCEITKIADSDIIHKSAIASNTKKSKKSLKTKFFLRKSRWVKI